MKNIIYLSIAALSLATIMTSCGGSDSAKNAFEQGLKDAANNLKNNSNAGGALSESWLCKTWVPAIKDKGPMSTLTLNADHTFKCATFDGTWKLDGTTLVLKSGFDIKYTINKTGDATFDLVLNDGGKYAYKVDGTSGTPTATAPTNDAAATTSSTSTSSSSTSSSSSSDEYQVGDHVKIKWNGSWYAGTIKAVKGGGKYKIGYDGYDATWDEVVGTDRLKK